MIPFPLHLESLLGKPLMYLIFLGIGFLFGYVLEISGFNHSPSLAAQFYFIAQVHLPEEIYTT